MELICIHKSQKNKVIVRDYPGGHALENDLGTSDGVNIIFFNKTLTEDRVYEVRTDAPYLQMHFELNGTVIYTPQLPGQETYVIYGSGHTLFYFPELNGRLTYPAGKDIFRVEIEISFPWLKRVFNNDLSLLGEFAEHIKKQQPAVLGGKSFPITRQIREVLMAIYTCDFSPPLKKIFIEGKLLELLSLQVNQMTTQKNYSPKSALKKDDIERIHDVKDLLTGNISNPPSINDLANMACMNRTKLQTAFKAMFGNTIYGYLADERMKKAHELLLSSAYVKIAEIARQVGYKNPNHFSTAFKNKFGYSPKDIQAHN